MSTKPTSFRDLRVRQWFRLTRSKQRDKLVSRLRQRGLSRRCNVEGWFQKFVGGVALPYLTPEQCLAIPPVALVSSLPLGQVPADSGLPGPRVVDVLRRHDLFVFYDLATSFHRYKSRPYEVWQLIEGRQARSCYDGRVITPFWRFATCRLRRHTTCDQCGGAGFSSVPRDGGQWDIVRCEVCSCDIDTNLLLHLVRSSGIKTTTYSDGGVSPEEQPLGELCKDLQELSWRRYRCLIQVELSMPQVKRDGFTAVSRATQLLRLVLNNKLSSVGRVHDIQIFDPPEVIGVLKSDEGDGFEERTRRVEIGGKL